MKRWCCSSEEKKGSLQDVANQKGVVCRAQGWKIHLCAAQLVQLVRNVLQSRDLTRLAGINMNI